MTNTLTISLELAERLDSPHSSVRNAALESLRRIIAAPVVERQEPVDAILLSDCVEYWVRDYGRGHFGTLDCVTKVYTSPPAPVAVVLPERLPEPNWDDFKPMSQEYEAACEGVSKWNACLDTVEEMNR